MSLRTAQALVGLQNIRWLTGNLACNRLITRSIRGVFAPLLAWIGPIDIADIFGAY